MTATDSGWGWFSRTLEAAGEPSADFGKAAADTCTAFMRCFATADGQRVLRHLRRMTLDRALGPGAPDALLRHLEGQRQLVAHILALSDHGAKGILPSAITNSEDTETDA